MVCRLVLLTLLLSRVRFRCEPIHVSRHLSLQSCIEAFNLSPVSERDYWIFESSLNGQQASCGVCVNLDLPEYQAAKGSNS